MYDIFDKRKTDRTNIDVLTFISRSEMAEFSDGVFCLGSFWIDEMLRCQPSVTEHS